ncbi:MAG: type VI secretion system baseplate subunit TssF [Polyangiaceae bacterium]|nr:type VI secretion system baseplate subunit TssF [Polyangiaceae bacterium]
MDPRLLRQYNRELQFLREMGGEFARDFPKIAGRLGMDGFEVSDPYVERLLEGFAFLTARVQLKLEDEFPRFTQNLLAMVYPHYLAPTPSIAIVQLRPDTKQGALANGVLVPRGTAMRSLIGKDEQTACEYRTAHDTTLFPLELTRFEYRANLGGLLDLRHALTGRARAAARIRLSTMGGVPLHKVALDALPLFFRGEAEVTSRLYEQFLGHALGVFVRVADASGPWVQLPAENVFVPLGFDDDEALLPYGSRSFQGYRLLQEYFACPERYHFVALTGLGPAVRSCTARELDLVVLFDSWEPVLDNTVDATNLALFCTPAVNLFPRRADRIHLTDDRYEYHIVPDKTRPIDFELYGVTEIVGHGSGVRRPFYPFYACNEAGLGDHGAYYTLYRVPRRLSDGQRARGTRSSYVGSETFLTLVDGDGGPFQSDIKQLALETLCTNRDLPLLMPIGQAGTDFTLESGAPVESVRCLAGPTPPRASNAHGDTAWRLISHLGLNHVSLVDGGQERQGAALREILSLYADMGEASLRREIDAVVATSTRPIIRHLSVDGMLSFGRGVEVTLTCDDGGFAGAGAFLFGAVLERFFARYASINSFTETVLRSVQRGEVMRWRPRLGQTRVV